MIAVGQRVKLISRAEIDAVSLRMAALNPGLWGTHYYDVPKIGDLGTVRCVSLDGLFEVAFDGKCRVLCDADRYDKRIIGHRPITLDSHNAVHNAGYFEGCGRR